MSNWKKLMVPNTINASDLVDSGDAGVPEGGTILRSMNGSLEWIDQTQFGNITYAGIGGETEGSRSFFISSVNPYGHIINSDSMPTDYDPISDPDFVHRKNINGQDMSTLYGLKGLPGNRWPINISTGFSDAMLKDAYRILGEEQPDTGGKMNILLFPDSYSDLLVNSSSLKKSGEWHEDANKHYIDSDGAQQNYTGLRTYGFLNTDTENGGNNPESNAIATITSHKRIMSVHFQGSWRASPDFLANNGNDGISDAVLEQCNIYAKPELVILVSPLIELGESNTNNWQDANYTYDGQSGVPLYSLVNAAGEEAIFTPTDMTGDSDMSYQPNDVTVGNGYGWTTQEIEDRGLGMAQRFPDINGETYSVDITKEGLDFEVLCPEGYFRNIYLAVGLRLATISKWDSSSLYYTRFSHTYTNVFEVGTPTGYIVMSSTSSSQFGNNTYNSSSL